MFITVHGLDQQLQRFADEANPLRFHGVKRYTTSEQAKRLLQAEINSTSAKDDSQRGYIWWLIDPKDRLPLLESINIKPEFVYSRLLLENYKSDEVIIDQTKKLFLRNKIDEILKAYRHFTKNVCEGKRFELDKSDLPREFVYTNLIITHQDVKFWDEWSCSEKIIQKLISDIDKQPPFAFLNLPEEAPKSYFWQTVRARKEIVELEVEELNAMATARLVKLKQDTAEGINIVQGMMATKSKVKTAKKSNNVYCSRSLCQKHGTSKCPAPVAGYCSGRWFCVGHCKNHEDHFGVGSTLKKITNRSATVRNDVVHSQVSQSNITITDDVGDDDNNSDEVDEEADNSDKEDDGVYCFESIDILCAICECQGFAEFFCERLTKRCRYRKFCKIHSPLCSNHLHLEFKGQYEPAEAIQLEVVTVKESVVVKELSITIDEATANITENCTAASVGTVQNEPYQSLPALITSSLTYNTDQISMNTDMAIVDTLEASWNAAIQFSSSTLDLNLLQENDPEKLPSRIIKIGTFIIILHLNNWRVCEIRPGMKEDQHYLVVKDNMDDLKYFWNALELKEYGKEKKWMILQKQDSNLKKRKIAT